MKQVVLLVAASTLVLGGALYLLVRHADTTPSPTLAYPARVETANDVPPSTDEVISAPEPRAPGIAQPHTESKSEVAPGRSVPPIQSAESIRMSRLTALERCQSRLAEELAAGGGPGTYETIHELYRLAILADMDTNQEYADTRGLPVSMTPYKDGELHVVSGPRKYDLTDLSRYPGFSEMQSTIERVGAIQPAPERIRLMREQFVYRTDHVEHAQWAAARAIEQLKAPK